MDYNYTYASHQEQSSPNERINYYDKYEAMSTSRRFFLGLVAYTLAASIIITVVGVVLALFAPDIYTMIGESAALTLILNSVAMYIFGTLILYLIVRNSRTRTRERKPLGADNLIILMLICQFLSIAGNLLGILANYGISLLTGVEQESGVVDMLDSFPLEIIFLAVVVLAPIFEELVFRKLLIDRFSVYGDRLAITVSALVFGAFHGNFEQFFYTAFVGAVWAYVYTRTGKLRYSVFMHMVMNFVGGFLPMYVLRTNEYTLAFSTIGLFLLQYGSAIAGFVLFILALIKRWYRVETLPTVRMPKRYLPRFLIFNRGALLFILVCACEFALYHLLPLIEAMIPM